MKKFISIQFFVLGFLSLPGFVIAQNQSGWLTMVGMPGEASNNTIEV